MEQLGMLSEIVLSLPEIRILRRSWNEVLILVGRYFSGQPAAGVFKS